VATKCPKCQTDNPETLKFCGECGTQLIPLSRDVRPKVTETLQTAIQELTTGSIFAGRYQIIEELGKGGMGRVYKVFDQEVQAKMALKLIKPEISADKNTIDRFRNELKIARDISHKNICRMYDLGREGGNYFITMEYVSGEDLKSFIRRAKQLVVGTAIFIAKQVCEGLAEAHRVGVVHRDLKPGNIMIDKEGNARIMDFGIARSVSVKGITGAGVMIGTPEYMSPEQVEGKEVDRRSDIYSLGIILYEMLTGHVPFEGDTPFIVGVKQKSEIPKDPKELNAQIPQDLSRLILKCLEKDKEKRYQNADELKDNLEKIEKGIPTAERPIPKRKTVTSKPITLTVSRKKFFVPISILAAIAAIAIGLWRFMPKHRTTLPPASSNPSIAVLPFTDLSPQKDQEYFCNGLAESLINALSKVKGLRVPAMTSTVPFKGEERDINEIAEKLNVNAVLRGSVQKAGNRLRITAQLINVADKSLLWSEQYSRDFNDLFSIQDEISFGIADKLKVNLLGEERQDLRKRFTENIKAYNLYLKGRYFWNKRTEDSLKMSIEYFEQAIDVDPNYALAYAGLADCYIILPFYSSWLPKEAYLKAREAAIRALELDSMLAEAHNSLAAVKLWYDWDWNASEREFKKSIELNAGLAIAHHWYAELLKSIGRFDEAIGEIKIALELDPLSPIINTNFGRYLDIAGRYDEALKQFRKTLEIDPEFENAHIGIGRVYLHKGMYKLAVEIFERTESPLLAYALMALSKKDEAQAVLEDFKEKSSRQYVDQYTFAVIYAALGEIDMAFEALEKAYQEHSINLVDYVYVDPFFDSIRPDPRFKSLMKKLNLED